ncbi:hypothetical protein EVAR_88885_1 [Eumeta japonica]|uniref:Uncharacterized protein n=1 Tax=Eumeta variegata TaxID=151549 RepID=A0A4C1XXI8_EUMVA|nr:hypothetical protein EVAR_88885_1 [Eumeta japonica]
MAAVVVIKRGLEWYQRTRPGCADTCMEWVNGGIGRRRQLLAWAADRSALVGGSGLTWAAGRAVLTGASDSTYAALMIWSPVVHQLRVVLAGVAMQGGLLASRQLNRRAVRALGVHAGRLCGGGVSMYLSRWPLNNLLAFRRISVPLAKAL